MTFTRCTVDVAGRRLRYLEAGPSNARGPIVMLHAFPLNARMWEAQVPLAAGGWRLIAPQFRQFDDADGDPPAASMDDYAEDVQNLMTALELRNAVVCGLSMGGYVAFALLRRAAHLVRALLLADTRPQADTPEGVEARKKMLQLVRRGGVTAIADEMLPKLLADSTRAERHEIVEHVRHLVLANSPDAIAGALTALMTRPDSTPLLASIRCPVAVVVGAADTVTPPAVAEEMHAMFAGSQLSVIAAAGHLSNIERPDAFNRACTRFLDQQVQV